MKDKILLYSQLSSDERAEIEAYVANHPELRPLLDEARAMGTLFEEARLLHADPPGDEVLAYYLATQHIDPHPTPQALAFVFSNIETRLETDEALRTRYDAIAQRMADLEAGSDTVSHFERVTGHHLRPKPTATITPLETTPSPTLSSLDRSPVHRRISRRGWTAMAVSTLMAIYLGLFAFSHLTVSPLDKLAAFEQGDLNGMGSALRSPGSDPDAAISYARFQDALVLLRDAYTSTLGIFPRYDTEALQTAGSLLEQVVSREADGSVVQLEAYYLLAKIRLAQQDVPAARTALQPVIKYSDSIRNADAEALLESIEALEE